jgi:hypothetical protein
MRKPTKFGLTLVAGLVLVWAYQPHTKQVEYPKDLAIVGKKATWEEKRENKRLAKKYAWVAFGWRGGESECLVRLWTRESRFDHLASNQQGSSAFGIAQVLGEKSRDPRIQILRGLRYIGVRYSSPCKAYNFFLRNGYY